MSEESQWGKRKDMIPKASSTKSILWYDSIPIITWMWGWYRNQIYRFISFGLEIIGPNTSNLWIRPRTILKNLRISLISGKIVEKEVTQWDGHEPFSFWN